jgi:hypothetical protein
MPREQGRAEKEENSGAHRQEKGRPSGTGWEPGSTAALRLCSGRRGGSSGGERRPPGNAAAVTRRRPGDGWGLAELRRSSSGLGRGSGGAIGRRRRPAYWSSAPASRTAARTPTTGGDSGERISGNEGDSDFVPVRDDGWKRGAGFGQRAGSTRRSARSGEETLGVGMAGKRRRRGTARQLEGGGGNGQEEAVREGNAGHGQKRPELYAPLCAREKCWNRPSALLPIYGRLFCRSTVGSITCN